MLTGDTPRDAPTVVSDLHAQVTAKVARERAKKKKGITRRMYASTQCAANNANAFMRDNEKLTD